jgi:hypothetical protein
MEVFTNAKSQYLEVVDITPVVELNQQPSNYESHSACFPQFLSVPLCANSLYFSLFNHCLCIPHYDAVSLRWHTIGTQESKNVPLHAGSSIFYCEGFGKRQTYGSEKQKKRVTEATTIPCFEAKRQIDSLDLVTCAIRSVRKFKRR